MTAALSENDRIELARQERHQAEAEDRHSETMAILSASRRARGLPVSEAMTKHERTVE